MSEMPKQEREKVIRYKGRIGLFVYVLACADDTYYVGMTYDFNRRVKQHRDGKGADFTRKHKPLHVCCYWEDCHSDKEFEVWTKFAKVWGPDKVGGFNKFICDKMGLIYPF
jgi:hypothetical protein